MGDSSKFQGKQSRREDDEETREPQILDAKPRGLWQQLDGRAPVQRQQARGMWNLVNDLVQRKESGEASAADPGAVASAGVQSASERLPHHEQIQASFGRHDISGVRAQTGGAAAEASRGLGASAYAVGDRVGFAQSPDLHTAAHEAAHVVQQRGGVQLKGGIDGGKGDAYEQHADAVADKVVRGESAEALLDAHSGAAKSGSAVQRKSSDQTGAVQLHPPSWEYCNTNRVHIMAAIADRIRAVSLPKPHERLYWPDRAKAEQVLIDVLRKDLETLDTKVLHRLMDHSFPVNLITIVDGVRQGTGKQQKEWHDVVGIAIANAMSEPIDASIKRMAMRLRVQLDGPAKGIPHEARLVPSCPLDVLVAEMLTTPGVVGGGELKKGRADDTPGKQFLKGAEPVTFRPLGERDPKLWNWIEVTSKNPTVEAVASTELIAGVPDSVMGPQMAYRIAASPPFFGLPIEVARRVDSLRHYATGKALVDADMGNFGRIADVTAIHNSTAKPDDKKAAGVTDDAATAQAAPLEPHTPPLDRLLDRVDVQLDAIRTRLARVGATNLMEGAQQFAARRRADLATDPKTASKWVPAVAGQEGILHTVSSELVDLFQELDRRLKSKKMGEDDAAKMLPVAVSELIRAFGRAAGASHLAAEANPLLADARRQKALLPLSLIDDQVRDAQVAVAAQGDTDEAGADDNVKSLSKTMTDTADLRLRITRGDTVTAKEASQVHSDSAELATRARVTTLASTVRTLKTEADAAGVSSGTNPDGSWSVQKICDLILHLAKDPAKAHTQHDSANELFGGWLPRLDDAKRVSAEQNEQDPYGRMQAAVAYVNREMDSMAKQLGGLKEFIEWANKQRQYAQLKHLLTSMALQIGLMIVTGEIAGAGLAAVRGIAMAGEIAEDVRGAGLLWKGAEVLAHAGMQTVASGAAGGEISGTAFAENALGMLLTSAAMKPFKSLLKGDEALERSVENELSKMGRLGKAVKTGAAITAEATIDLGAGVIGSGVAHSVTHGTEMGIASRDEWMTQGFALAASAFVHSHSEGMHARLQEAAREFRHAKLPQAAEAIDVLSLEAQRLGARSTTNKHASPEEAGAMLSERHRLLVQEGAIYSQYGGRNGTVAEVNADLNATNAGLIEIPFQLARLSPVVDGLSYEGTGKEIANAFRGAADNNIELTRRQDEKGVWTVVAGDRTLTIKQVDFAANREHSGPESAGAEVGKAAAPREEPSPEKRKPAGKERLGAHSYASGSSLGLAPTPETIRQGTVRMEDHPDFQSKIEELQRRGYRFEYNPDPNEDPHVHVRQVLTREGKTVRFEKTVFGNRGMRFLDLEHELGHVDQLEGLKTPMPNDQVLENGRPYKGPEIPKVNKQRAAIIEYENRLQEFFRLRARRIDPSVLEEHANGVRAARDFYNERMAEEKTAGRKFRDESFPQMKALESRFENEEGWSYTDAHQERTL